MLLTETEQSERVTQFFSQQWARVSSNLAEVGIMVARLQSNKYTVIWEIQGLACSAGVLLVQADVISSRSFIRPDMFDLQ